MPQVLGARIKKCHSYNFVQNNFFLGVRHRSFMITTNTIPPSLFSFPFLSFTVQRETLARSTILLVVFVPDSCQYTNETCFYGFTTILCLALNDERLFVDPPSISYWAGGFVNFLTITFNLSKFENMLTVQWGCQINQ